MTADLKTVNLPRILLLASPDDFLLELERRVAVDTWQSANPQGEIVSFDQAPSATRVVQELASPSLFASDRLIVISDASVCFTAGRRSDAEDLARGLTSLPLAGVTLLLSAV
jgi:DNA polymerase III delta subunit